MVRIEKNDILKATQDIIGHQVNCMGASGGLAYYIFKEHPTASYSYEKLCSSHLVEETEIALLGKCYLHQGNGKIIANLFGQYYPGKDSRLAALKSALTELANHAHRLKKSVALPYNMACGIGGADWENVYETILNAFEPYPDVECVIYNIRD